MRKINSTRKYILMCKMWSLVELYFSCWVIFFLLSYFFLLTFSWSSPMFHVSSSSFDLLFMTQLVLHSTYVDLKQRTEFSSFLSCNISMQKSHKYIHIIHLTAVAWVSGPNLAPQKMKLCLMRCKKYFEIFFYLA